MTAIAPSLLSADFAQLAHDIERVEACGVEWLHVDVMDGHFVPNLTIGPPVVRSIKRVASAPLDVHLMIADPLAYAEPFAQAGADLITFHVEAVDDPQPVIARIRELGCQVGLAVSPATPVERLLPWLDRLDLALVMSVNPGFGGQSFMPEVLPKLEAIRAANPGVLREIDGGITGETAAAAVAAGATLLVSGSYVFGASDVTEPIAALRRAAATCPSS